MFQLDYQTMQCKTKSEIWSQSAMFQLDYCNIINIFLILVFMPDNQIHDLAVASAMAVVVH